MRNIVFETIVLCYQENMSEEQKKQEEPRLFDSIRDDIENTTTPPQLRGEKVIPAVDIQKHEPKVLTPVMDKPSTNSNTKPASNTKTTKPSNTQPKNTIQQEKKLPQYDWNIKNINLQKIGNLH